MLEKSVVNLLSEVLSFNYWRHFFIGSHTITIQLAPQEDWVT